MILRSDVGGIKMSEWEDELRLLDGDEASNTIRRRRMQEEADERQARKVIEDWGIEGTRTASRLVGEKRARELYASYVRRGKSASNDNF